MDYFIHSLFLVSLSTNIAGNQVRGISRFFSLRRGRGGWISGVRLPSDHPSSRILPPRSLLSFTQVHVTMRVVVPSYVP